MNKRIIVGIADMSVSTSQDTELVTYALGSCIGITVYDPLLRIGGLLHIMLPHSFKSKPDEEVNPYMFGDLGLPLLFDEMLKHGAMKVRLVVKIAGGADRMQKKQVFNVGERNITFVKEFFHNCNLKIVSEAVGGTRSRTVIMDINTGKVIIKSPGIRELEL